MTEEQLVKALRRGELPALEAVRGLVLAGVKAPAGRKRMPAKKKALLAAALAAVTMPS